MNKKQQLLTSLISEINKPKPQKELIINGLSELETETKKDCSHCQHHKYAEQISAIKAEGWDKKSQISTKKPYSA